jgi:thioredoxin-related protein
MKTIRTAAIAAAIAGLSFTAGRATAEETAPAAKPEAAKAELWGDNFEAAKTQAKKEGKDILIDFTGSDWCGWCIKLKKEVFSTPEFEAAAPKKFVLVEADFPRNKAKLSADVQAQNNKLQQQFGVQGFPTIYLLDGEGRPYAQTGYRPGGPAAYLKSLEELQDVRVKRDAAWKKAEAAQGVEKAKLLAEGLAAMNEELVAGNYASVIGEIKKLDPQDTTGMVKKHEFKAKMGTLEKDLGQAMQDANGDSAAGAKVIDDFIAANKPAGEDLQKVMMLKINLYPPRSVENCEKAMALMDEVVAVDATTKTGKMAERIKKSAEMYKQRLGAKAAAEKKAAEEK